jgi:hypothetical protein
MREIERHPGGAGAQDAQEGDHRFQRAVHGEPDAALRRGAQPGERRRHPRRAGGELAVGERAVAVDQGFRRWRRRRLGEHQVVQARRPRQRRAAVGQGEDLGPLGRRQQVEVEEELAGVRHHRREERGQARQQPLGGGGGEEVGIDGEEGGESVALLSDRQREVELFRPRIGGLPGSEAQAAGGHPAERRQEIALAEEHHLDQRRVGETALGADLLHQALERQLLVRDGFAHRLAGGGEEIAERPGRVDGEAQRQAVGEEAHGGLGLGLPRRDGSAQEEVALGAVAGEKGGEAGGQHHEDRRALGPPEVAERGGERRRDDRGAQQAVVALYRRPRVVAGQVDELRRAGQAAAPEGDLAGQPLAAQPEPLPAGEVGVLQGGGGKRRQAGPAAAPAL